MNRPISLLLALLAIAVSSAADGQTFTVLGSFNGTNGANPYGSLTISGSTLYGTTAYGGATAMATYSASTRTAADPKTCCRSAAPTAQIPLAV